MIEHTDRSFSALVSDNRVAAMARSTTAYTFAAPATTTVTAEATLLFRRAFKQLMDEKGWNVDDIVMESGVVVVPP